MTEKNGPTGVRKYLLFIKFSLVGLLNTGIDFFGFLLLDAVGVYPLIAHVCSYTAGLVNSYFWNKFWTFRQARVYTLREASLFLIVNLVALGLAGAVLFVCINLFHLSDALAKALAIPFSFAVNFIGNKYFVFRGEPVKAKQED